MRPPETRLRGIYAVGLPARASGCLNLRLRVAAERLAELETEVVENRLVLNDGHLFDTQGRRIEIEPVVDA